MVLLYDMSTRTTVQTSEPVFSQIVDLKIYRGKVADAPLCVFSQGQSLHLFNKILE